MNLAVHQQRIDYLAAIIDRDVAHNLCLARFLVDLNDADMRAEREGKILRFEEVGRRQAGLGVRRDLFGDVCRQRNALRARVVPDEAMAVMAAKLVPPAVEEGFSRVTVVRY